MTSKAKKSGWGWLGKHDSLKFREWVVGLDRSSSREHVIELMFWSLEVAQRLRETQNGRRRGEGFRAIMEFIQAGFMFPGPCLHFFKHNP